MEAENDFFLDASSGELTYSSNFTNKHVCLDESSGEFVPAPAPQKEPLQNLTNKPQMYRPRKTKADPSLWQANIRKKARIQGQSYVNKQGHIVPAKFVKPMCTVCRLNCESRVLMEDRIRFFNNYYKHTSNEKYGFLLKYTKTIDMKIFKKDSRRQISRLYFIPTNVVENGSFLMQRVCKFTFLATLDITDKVVRNAYDKENRGLALTDLRGSHVRLLSDIDLDRKVYVRQHIESFPLVESHYCRKENINKYLCSELSVSKMYDLYQQKMIENNVDSNLIVPIQKYRKIFNEEYDLRFNTLKKDACDACVAFKNGTSTEKNDLRQNHEMHLKLKDRARDRKQEHKVASQRSNSICASVFDYQKGIQLPRGNASSFYYKRKLVVHNFTVYDLKTKDPNNYVYDESLSGVGPNEVSSFLSLYIKEKVATGMKDFRFISDNCAGQQHNRFVFFFYVYMSHKLNIDVTHTFLVSGHTQNEGDTVHSVIERALGNNTFYTASEVYDMMRNARKIKPYNVIEVNVNEIFNFKVRNYLTFLMFIKKNSFSFRLLLFVTHSVGM